MFANILYDTATGRTVLHAMPLLLGALCALAIAYRYYSAFLAAKVAALDDSRTTPAHRFNDGQNYHPTNKWVLFGHHFAAISGAGPLIGPVLAIQYGYLPGLLWLVIGVCLAGAVQDMLVLAASVRRGGKSLAEIARTELGPWATVAVSAAILFIVIIALAGLGFVVVKALGGEEVKLPDGMQITLPENGQLRMESEGEARLLYFPKGCLIAYGPGQSPKARPESFVVRLPKNATTVTLETLDSRKTWAGTRTVSFASGEAVHCGRETFKNGGPSAALGAAVGVSPANLAGTPGCIQVVPGSSWGTFTIACTIPIALFVGLWMYKIRKGRVVEASLIGAVGVLGATLIGHWIPGSPLERFFSLSKEGTVFALCAYGFVASVLPVWMLLCPRDYLSSFLKIGTIALLVVGTAVANPSLPCPLVNQTFEHGGPTFQGSIFPFVFICIMCGSISGFHALVSSGTTPKMIDRESHVRPIGYGAMLMEGLVGIVALIAAASMPPSLYYDINVDLDKAPEYQADLDQMYKELGIDREEEAKTMPEVGAVGPHNQLTQVKRGNLADIESMVGGESLRGRTGGAVTLAVGMARIFTLALSPIGLDVTKVMPFWYHFAIMFEALFILTTIDTGTRIARFLLQEAASKVIPQFEKTDWLPGAALATLVVTAGWGVLVYTGSIDTIWPMFGIANQLLAVVALALVTTLLVNTGRGRYAPITVLPMLFVTATTMSAAAEMCTKRFPVMMGSPQPAVVVKGTLSLVMTIFVVCCVAVLLLLAVSRWLAVWRGVVPVREEPSEAQLAALRLAADGNGAPRAAAPDVLGDAIQAAAPPEVKKGDSG
jgi:carbon starvation protein